MHGGWAEWLSAGGDRQEQEQEQEQDRGQEHGASEAVGTTATASSAGDIEGQGGEKALLERAFAVAMSLGAKVSNGGRGKCTPAPMHAPE